MKELIINAQLGDRKALRELLVLHRPLIESVVHRFAWDGSVKEDIMQNVCIKVISSIMTFSGGCRFSTWVYRIVVNECIDANRKLVRYRMKFQPVEQVGNIFADLNAPDGLSGSIGQECRSAVIDAVSRLPEGMRVACELYYLQQQTGEEAAAKLQISVPAFFVRLSAARERLKKELLKKGLEYAY